MTTTTIIHCLSGGLDSVTMLYDLHGQGQKLHCVLFDYHQRHVQELQFAKGHCRRLAVPFTTVELPMLLGSKLTDGSGTWNVPNRNMVLLSVAVNLALQAGAARVTYACNKDDAGLFPDCRMAFVEAMNEALKVQSAGVKIVAPYIGMTKRQIGKKARTLGVPMHELWSCYKGGDKPCGECPACQKMEEALCGR